jgi:hypothetical protein
MSLLYFFVIIFLTCLFVLVDVLGRGGWVKMNLSRERWMSLSRERWRGCILRRVRERKRGEREGEKRRQEREERDLEGESRKDVLSAVMMPQCMDMTSHVMF